MEFASLTHKLKFLYYILFSGLSSEDAFLLWD